MQRVWENRDHLLDVVTIALPLGHQVKDAVWALRLGHKRLSDQKRPRLHQPDKPVKLRIPGLKRAAAISSSLFSRRVFYKVKSRSAHMKSHAEQEKKAAALRQKEAEERAAAEAAAALAARQQNGTRQLGGDSTNDDSSDAEDVDDEDWP